VHPSFLLFPLFHCHHCCLNCHHCHLHCSHSCHLNFVISTVVIPVASTSSLSPSFCYHHHHLCIATVVISNMSPLHHCCHHLVIAIICHHCQYFHAPLPPSSSLLLSLSMSPSLSSWLSPSFWCHHHHLCFFCHPCLHLCHHIHLHCQQWCHHHLVSTVIISIAIVGIVSFLSLFCCHCCHHCCHRHCHAIIAAVSKPDSYSCCLLQYWSSLSKLHLLNWQIIIYEKNLIRWKTYICQLYIWSII